MKLNLNEIATAITLQEGKKVSLPIGQVKEVMRLTLRWMASLSSEQVETVLRRYRTRR
jgi:predicted DNA-binding antitoxin AbrB/MazE fold protein